MGVPQGFRVSGSRCVSPNDPLKRALASRSLTFCACSLYPKFRITSPEQHRPTHDSNNDVNNSSSNSDEDLYNCTMVLYSGLIMEGE